MEVISWHSAPCCHASSLRGITAEKSIDCQSRLFSSKNKSYHLDIGKSKWVSSRYPQGHFGSKSKKLNRVSRVHSSLDGVQNADSGNFIDEYGTYVTDSGDDVRKAVIPGLPDEDNGATISRQFWEWKPNLKVYYETSGSENINSPPVLFLPGFGVGSFHYEKQLKDLGRDYRVWALDFLGQGMSLPDVDPTPQLNNGGEPDKEHSLWGFGNETEPWANQLVYSIDLWQDQVRYFIEEVIKEPVYLAGNSLGGFVALSFAACNPQLVKGVTLLNATPFWGFIPNPKRSPRLSKVFPWAGTFPLPANVRKLVQIVWEKVSDPTSIAGILKQVYADHSTDVDKVFDRIMETTRHPAAAASLASIMFAPQGQLSFGDSLKRCQMGNVPICLVYGKEDPWVQPIWGLRVKRQLPEAPYYQISPAGHCPHDEVPEVVNYLLRGWIKNLESKGSVVLPLLENQDSVEHDTALELEFLRQGSKRTVKVRLYGSDFSLWDQISSFINTRIKDIKMKFP